MVKIITVIFCFAFIFIGCSAKRQLHQKPSNIKQIEYNEEVLYNAYIPIKNLHHKENTWKVILGDDNKIKAICYSLKECYEKVKRVKEYSLFGNQEVVYMDRFGFSPNFSIKEKDVQCGRGNLLGWPSLLFPPLIKDHNKTNSFLCHSRFSKVHSTQLGIRTALGLLTFGTTFLTGGNMHTRTFDKNAFTQALNKAKITQLQFISFKEKGNYDVLYLDMDDIKESLEDYYNVQKYSNHKSLGLLVLDEKSHNLLGFLFYKDNTHQNILKNISMQIRGFTKGYIKNIERTKLTQYDLKKYIPNKIDSPTFPKAKEFQKSEFETIETFDARVKEAVKQREQLVNRLNQNYILKVQQRNNYIALLEKIYEEYLNTFSKELNIKNQQFVNNNIYLAKLLFLKNFQGFELKNQSFDAQTNRLFFEIESNDKSLVHKGFIKTSVVDAKSIKLGKNYLIEPVIAIKDTNLQLKSFNIIETKSQRAYPIVFSNINFKPIEAQVNILLEKDKNHSKISQNVFNPHYQKSSPIEDWARKEAWYIEVVDTINSKVPSWFSNPKYFSNHIYTYGNTLEEAKLNAIEDIAAKNEIIVNSKKTYRTEYDNLLKDYKEFKKEIKIEHNSKVKMADLKIIKQEKIDGVWYVLSQY